MIGFKNIPAGIRTPLFYAEVDNSRANSAQSSGRTLIIGQKLVAGDATADIPIQSQGIGDAKSRFGVGSVLALMVEWYRKRDASGEVWCLPLADDGSGTAATGTVAFTGTATAAGTLSLYVAGTKLPVSVTVGMAAAQLATAVAAVATAATDLPVSAAVSTGTVTFTARNKGLLGNDIDLRLNYRGTPAGETLPAGITATVTAMANGATNPSLTAGLAALGDAPFDFIVCPYTDATSLDAMKALMNDVTGRWSWSAQSFGGVFSAIRGTVGSRTTFGLTRNDQHVSIIGFNESPTPAFLWAANYAAACAGSLRADPALPLQTLALDVLAPPSEKRDTQPQRNVLLYDGLTTYVVDGGGTVRIDNAITTYQTNAFGQADDSYLQVETLFTLAEVLRRLKGVVSSKYARVKLASNGTRVAPGSDAVTPNTIRADIIATYQEMEGALVEDAVAFAANVVVERDATNPRRVNVFYPPNLINSLGVLAVLAQFRA